jgi:hypothetical protein
MSPTPVRGGSRRAARVVEHGAFAIEPHTELAPQRVEFTEELGVRHRRVQFA